MTDVKLHAAANPSAMAAAEHNIEPNVVSFVIPALNEEKHICACLESIKRLELPPNVAGIEIIVVDNRSGDRTVELSRAKGARVVEVPPKNASTARNAGAREARGDWLAFVDADCELSPGWLTSCGAHFAAGRNTVAVAGVAAAPPPEASWIEHTSHELWTDNSPGGARQVGWLATFNLLVLRSAFDSIGGFNENLATCEDCDLSYRLAEHGSLVLEPRTNALHSGVSCSLGDLFRREAWRSGGNLCLALRRPFDWSNWLSLLVPPCLVLGFLTFSTLSVAAIYRNKAYWPLVMLAAATIAATVILAVRKSRPAGTRSFIRRMIVMATYLAGRTAGLFWPFPRVNR